MDKNLSEEFKRIMQCECALSKNNWACGLSPECFYDLATAIMETCKLSFASRSYNVRYHLTTSQETYESVGAHTNFASDILKAFLIYFYGPNAHFLEGNYTYNEVMDAMSRHDKPEARYGDIPDNGTRDENLKRSNEEKYQRWLSSLMPPATIDYEKNVLSLLQQMETKKTFLGRSLYLADKISALLANLYLDSIGDFPYRTIDDDELSDRDVQEINIIFNEYGIADLSYHYKGSEMWAIDYFKSRNIIDYDDTGFFTSLLVMYTLMVNGGWYDWREGDY